MCAYHLQRRAVRPRARDVRFVTCPPTVLCMLVSSLLSCMYFSIQVEHLQLVP
jgi:hypothetical protein